VAWQVERWRTIDGLEQSFGGRLEDDPEGVTTLRQVHGRAVFVAAEVVSRQTPGDGLLVDRPGCRVGVWTADCVPLHLVAAGRRVAAAIHCGWRGSAAGILEEAIGVLERRFAVRPADLEAALGPSIGGCCYTVGSEVREAFVARAGARLGGTGFEEQMGTLRLDLRTFLAAELADLGVGRVERVGPCTSCRTDLLHSYRREPQTTGRQLSWVGWRA
jgi:YfiH family protein